MLDAINLFLHHPDIESFINKKNLNGVFNYFFVYKTPFEVMPNEIQVGVLDIYRSFKAKDAKNVYVKKK